MEPMATPPLFCVSRVLKGSALRQISKPKGSLEGSWSGPRSTEACGLQGGGGTAALMDRQTEPPPPLPFTTFFHPPSEPSAHPLHRMKVVTSLRKTTFSISCSLWGREVLLDRALALQMAHHMPPSRTLSPHKQILSGSRSKSLINKWCVQ